MKPPPDPPPKPPPLAPPDEGLDRETLILACFAVAALVAVAVFIAWAVSS